MSRLALVTGAAQGIGLAIAQRMASKADTVILTDIQGDAVEARAAELRDAGHDARAYAVDTSSEESVQALLDQVKATSAPFRFSSTMPAFRVCAMALRQNFMK